MSRIFFSKPINWPGFPGLISFFIVSGILTIVQLKVNQHRPMLLAERYFPGWGWLEIFFASLYAFWLTGRMLDVHKSPVWRRRAWRLFSAVFFGQLVFGLLGAEKFLMTGKLHLPVPAMILAGPLFRGKISFMLILFLSTVALVGSAWCSHLCYIGVWDDAVSRMRRRPTPLPGWRQRERIIIFFLLISTAWGLRASGSPSFIATLLASLFGVAGIFVMLLWSRKSGQMAHCVAYCPVGLVADWLGKLNPFRVEIGGTCDECGACTAACRYDALKPEDIKRRRPGFSCSLCGDCLRACHARAIHYRLGQLQPHYARRLFIVIVVSLHALFLALARL